MNELYEIYLSVVIENRSKYLHIRSIFHLMHNSQYTYVSFLKNPQDDKQANQRILLYSIYFQILFSNKDCFTHYWNFIGPRKQLNINNYNNETTFKHSLVHMLQCHWIILNREIVVI